MIWYNYILLKLNKINNYVIILKNSKEVKLNWFIDMLNMRYKKSAQLWFSMNNYSNKFTKLNSKLIHKDTIKGNFKNNIIKGNLKNINNIVKKSHSPIKFKSKIINFFFLNCNVSINYPVKKWKLLKFIKYMFVLPFLKPVANLYSYMISLNFKKIFFKRFLLWYRYIIRDEKFKNNINNFTIYIKKFFYYIRRIKCLIRKFNIKLYKIKKYIKFWKFNFGNIKIKINKYKKRFYKIYKKKCLLSKLQDVFKIKVNNFKNNFFNLNKKIILNYNVFSFKLKKLKIKLKIKKKKKYFLRNLNLIFFINIFFFKFLFNLFMNWLNQFNLFYNNHNNYYYNFKINFIIRLNLYKRFMYKKRFKKLSFLDYMKNTQFLLFFNKIKLNKELNLKWHTKI